MKPAGISPQEFVQSCQRGDASRHSGGAHVGLGNASVRCVVRHARKTLRALCMWNGGERIDDF